MTDETRSGKDLSGEPETRQEEPAQASAETGWPGSKRLRHAIVVLELLTLAGTFVVLWTLWLIRDLPDEEAIKRYRPRTSTEVRDVNDRPILYLGRHRNRIWLPLKSFSPWLIKAVVTSEDDTFFEHDGIRVEEIRKAFVANLKKGRYARGASTITQQLAKNAFLSHEKTLSRKMREFFLAFRIEKVLPKWRILELYLNEVEWGEGLYGAQTAARTYFGKSAGALTLPEAAMLAAMLPNPRYYNPFERLEKVKEKQQRVLRLMHHNRVITDAEYQAAIASPLRLAPAEARVRLARKQDQATGCIDATLTEYLEEREGERLYGSGYKLRLTLDAELQRSLRRKFGTGAGNHLLMLMQGGVVRAFTCIGGSPWETAPLPPWGDVTPGGADDGIPATVHAGYDLERRSRDSFMELDLLAPPP